MTGPAEDLYMEYATQPAVVLPPPRGFPFNIQGKPVYFDQPHIGPEQVAQATQYQTTNPLPFQHFVGVGINGGIPKQINQPDFLGVNEDIYIQY